MKKLFLALLVVFMSQINFAQPRMGAIKGLVVEKQNGEPVPFANVILMQGSEQKLVTTTDFDGVYILKPIPFGVYDIRFEYVGFTPHKISQIVVDSLKLVVIDVEISKGVELEEVAIYAAPIIEVDRTEVGTTVTRTAITQMAVRSVADISKTAGNGIRSRDNGRRGNNVRGQRRNSSVTFIDGVKIQGSSHFEVAPVPQDYGSELYQNLADNKFQLAKSIPLSTFSIDVDKASYANTRRFLNEGMLPPVNAVRIEELINYFDYDYPQPKGEHPFSITTELAACPWNAERKLALIGIQGKNIDLDEAPKSNLVFLIDVSGSMSSSDKLPLLQKGLALLVDELRAEDRVAIVVYAGAAGVVLKSTSGNQKTDIKSAINRLRSGGSTAGGAGIQLAYEIAEKNFVKNGNNRIILASDGDFNVGTSSQEALVELIEKKRESGVFLSVLGFGMGNLQDYKMEQLADKGNGNYSYIDNLLEAQKVLVTEMGGTLFTIAKDVKVQAEFNPNKVKAYRLIGYVNRALVDEDFNDDKKDAGELGAGHSVTVLYEIIPVNSTEKIMDVDPLKYQALESVPNQKFPDDLLTVKFRYKLPESNESILFSKVMKDEVVELSEASTNLQFSAAVACFGMKLRNSESVKEISYEAIGQMAKKAKGVDEEGYRSQFVQMIQMADLISNSK